MLYSILSQINKGLRRIPILRQTRLGIQPHYGLASIPVVSADREVLESRGCNGEYLPLTGIRPNLMLD
jgi:hypothetical protein